MVEECVRYIASCSSTLPVIVDAGESVPSGEMTKK